jgi:hypothetical protein
MTDKFEQLLEFVVNDEMDKANELFHAIVVEKSRQIYEGLISSEAEEVGNDSVDSLIDAISDEEGAIAEEGDDVEEVPGEEGDMPPMDGELDAPAGEADAGDIEAKIDDIADALAQLKAQFADMAAGLGDEADHEEMPMDDEAPVDGEEEPKEEGVLEYKEPAPKPVLTDSPGNGKSTVAGKNDMGGTTANIAKGSSAENGRSAPKVGSLTSANTEFDLKKVSAPSNKA